MQKKKKADFFSHPDRPSSHCSVQSSAEDEIDAVRDKLNVTEIHEVVGRLRYVKKNYSALFCLVG